MSEYERFEEHISFRMFKDVRDKISVCVSENRDKYDHEADFIRASIVKLLKEEGYTVKHPLAFD